MANQTLLDDYTALASTHWLYERNRDRWQFLMESYTGGEEYRRAGHLTRYNLETQGEYNSRLANTPLDNHCQNVISTYVSFMFREEPERATRSWGIARSNCWQNSIASVMDVIGDRHALVLGSQVMPGMCLTSRTLTGSYGNPSQIQSSSYRTPP